MNLLDLIISPAFAEGSAGGSGDPLGGLPFLISNVCTDVFFTHQTTAKTC